MTTRVDTFPEAIAVDQGASEAPLALVHELSADRPRFRLFTDREIEALPPVEWLLAPLMPEGGLTVLYGPPGAGKSFLALDWAAAIARGVTWKGCAVRRGIVVYTAADGGQGLQQRVAAYRTAHEVTGSTDAYYVLQAVNLLELSDVTRFLDDAERELTRLREFDDQYPALFVFDTVARSMAGGDENSTQDMGRVVANADLIRARMKAAVLLVHHTGKMGDAERGSSALRGAADAMFALKNEDGALLLECTKQRDAAPAEPVRLRLIRQGESCVVEPDEGQPREGLAPTHRKLLETALGVSQDGETSASILTEVSGLSKAAVYRGLKQMIDLRYITKRGRMYVLTAYGESLVSRSLR